MENRLFSFEKLVVYQQSRQLVKDVYITLRTFPREENYGLCDQLRRAVVSIPSNIAEGMSRRAPKEQMHFLQIAFGSLMEVLCQLNISFDLGYITEEQNQKFRIQIQCISRMINALHASLESK